METRIVPVNVYQEGQRVMVAAPVPGLEPQDIHIEVRDRLLTIEGGLRGPGRERTQNYVLQEWSVGPYRRDVDLPSAVDASRANAAYDNGVLVVILPVSARAVSGTVTIPKVGTSKGQLSQHVGQDMHPR